MSCNLTTSMERTQIAGDGMRHLRLYTLQAIYTAAVAGNHTTASIDGSTAPESNLITVIQELRQQGFLVTEQPNQHFTVTWQIA